MTGDPNLVKVTSSAADFVKAAASLALPQSLIKAADVTAALAGSNAAVGITSVAERQDVPGHYVWSTAPFVLSGNPNTATLNKLSVTAKTATGAVLTTNAEITFHSVAGP